MILLMIIAAGLASVPIGGGNFAGAPVEGAASTDIQVYIHGRAGWGFEGSNVWATVSVYESGSNTYVGSDYVYVNDGYYSVFLGGTRDCQGKTYYIEYSVFNCPGTEAMLVTGIDYPDDFVPGNPVYHTRRLFID